MSEEEKKAIEVLKEWLCKTHSKFCKVGAVGIPNIEFFATETVLKLIEKQQKEIEVLREENFDTVYMKAVADFKDKIRGKIEQLEIVKNTPVKDNNYTYKECIEYGIEELKEILEE